MPPQLQYEIGKLFVRISYDQIATLDDFQQMLIHGELSRQLSSLPGTVVPRRRTRSSSSPGVRPAP